MGRWDTEVEVNDAVPFVVDDGTGEVLVDPPTGGRIDPPVVYGQFDLEFTDHRTVENEPTPAPIRQFVERTADPDRIPDLGGEGTWRYTEGIVVPGDDVVVMGDVEPSGNTRAGTEYTITGETDPGSFFLSNKPEERIEVEVGTRKVFALLVYVVGASLILTGLALLTAPWLFLP